MKIIKLVGSVVAITGLIIASVVIYNRVKAKEGLANNSKLVSQLTMKFQNERAFMQNMADYLTQIDTCSEFFSIELSNGEFYFKNDFLKQGERLPLENFFKTCNQEQPHAACCNANENKNLSSAIQTYMRDHQLNRIIIRNTGDNLTIRYKYPDRLFHPADRELTMNYSVEQYFGHQASDINPSDDYNWKVTLSPNWWIESKKLTYR